MTSSALASSIVHVLLQPLCALHFLRCILRFTVGLLLEVWVLAMSRRRSGAKKPEADAAGAMPAPAEPDAWRELRQCVDRLKQSKMWVESGAEPLPVSGVTALAADWRGSDIPQDALCPGSDLIHFLAKPEAFFGQTRNHIPELFCA